MFVVSTSTFPLLCTVYEDIDFSATEFFSNYQRIVKWPLPISDIYTSGSAGKLSTVAASDLVEAIKWYLCAHMEVNLGIFAMTWVYRDIIHVNLGFCRRYWCVITPISAKQTQSYWMHIGYHGKDTGRFSLTLIGVSWRGNSYTFPRTKGDLKRVARAFVRMRGVLSCVWTRWTERRIWQGDVLYVKCKCQARAGHAPRIITSLVVLLYGLCRVYRIPG